MTQKLLVLCALVVAVCAVTVLSSDEWDPWHDAKWVPPTTYRIGHYENPLLKISHNGLKYYSSLSHLFNKGHKHKGHTKHVVKIHHHHHDAGWHAPEPWW